MRTNLKKIIPVVLAAALLPASVAGQEPAPVEPSQLPEEAQELIVELQQVQSNLEQIRQQALADPELQAEQAAIGEQIQVAMAETDPSVPQRIERLEALMGEAQAAQAEQDQERMQEIVDEARQIEGQLQSAQQEAISRPEIAPRLEGFQTKLQEKMVEVDPSTTQLLERLEEIDTRLAPYVDPGQ